MKRNLLALVSLLAFSISLFACGPGGDTAPKIASDKGTYEASLTGPASYKAGEKGSVTISIFKKGETTPAAAVEVKKVTFIHTVMGHGGDTEPEAVKASDGKFTINKLSFMMPGMWKLSLELGNGEKIAFEIKVS